jgi:protein-S-isoprenylcysteine O-methyltransferase Ste14
MSGLMFAFPKRYADAVARLRVPAGFVIVTVFAWFSHPTAQSLWIGVPVSLCGMAVRAWAAGCLEKNERLATGGPYAYTRNPLYMGTLLVATGLVIGARSLGLGVFFAAVFVLIYLPVIQLEEQHLRRLFPEYKDYADEVPVLWPRLTPYPKGSPGSFRVRLYLKNQEYQAAAGWIGGVLFLLWKALR